MSSKIILYYISASPPSRSVLLTAKALGIELDLRTVNLFEDDHLKPEYIKVIRLLNSVCNVTVLHSGYKRF